MLYYGDEVGMEGGPDPDCRRPMIWEPAQQDQELLSYFRQLIVLRHKHPALRADGVWTCLAQNEPPVYAYLRGELPLGDTTPGSDVALIVLNNSPTPQHIAIPLHTAGRAPQPLWPDGTLVHDELTGQLYTITNGKVTIPLPPYQAAILTTPHESP